MVVTEDGLITALVAFVHMTRGCRSRDLVVSDNTKEDCDETTTVRVSWRNWPGVGVGVWGVGGGRNKQLD